MSHTLSISLLVTLALATSSAHAVRLQDAKFYNYDLRFTNPWCGPHAYEQPVKSANGGKALTEKPNDVYCNGPEDGKRSGTRPDAVQQSIVNWVNDPSTKEIFFAALSFSNSAFYGALCDAAKRGVKIDYVLDAPGGPTGKPALETCGKSVRFFQRGHATGVGSGDGINWAHNKIIMINADSDPEKLQIAVGSGNFSSGMVTHHENWHFITAAKNTYFMQSHLCLREALIGESARAKSFIEKFKQEKKFAGALATYTSREGYGRFVAECRKSTGLTEESDIQAYFTPGTKQTAQGQMATKRITDGIAASKQILIGAHRFTYSRMVAALEKRLQSGPADIRLISDDDLYWLTVPESQGGGQFGDNGPDEARKVQNLLAVGGGSFKVKYMETNHGAHQLHHSKYLVFDNALTTKQGAIFTGAGNLTGDAFDNNQPSGNFENFYYIQIPEKVEQFRKQYAKLWGDTPALASPVPGKDFRGQATSAGDMPVGNPLPN